MDLLAWNMMQISEALGEVNRYFFWKHYGRDATSDHELVMYYGEYGAAEFADKHRGELECTTTED